MSEGSFIEIVALPTEGEEQAAVQEKAETDNLAPLPPPAAVVLPGPLSKFTLVPTWEHSLQAPINLYAFFCQSFFLGGRFGGTDCW
jgi:hypothetical protein